MYALDVKLIAQAEHFALEGNALHFIDLIEFFGDPELVPDFKWPEDTSDADWDAKAPQVLHVHIKLHGAPMATC